MISMMDLLSKYILLESARFLYFGFLAVLRTIAEIVFWRYFATWLEKFSQSLESLHKYGLNQYSISQGVSIFLSLILSYVVNRYLAFADTPVESELAIIVPFFVVSTITFVLSIIMMSIMTEHKTILEFKEQLPIIKDHWPMTSKLFIIAALTMVNYISYKFIFNV